MASFLLLGNFVPPAMAISGLTLQRRLFNFACILWPCNYDEIRPSPKTPFFFIFFVGSDSETSHPFIMY